MNFAGRRVFFVVLFLSFVAEVTFVQTKAAFGDIILPDDTSERFAVRQLSISGNRLIPTEQLLQQLPVIYNASTVSLSQADPNSLYDFSALCEIIDRPGTEQQISKRTMQGFTNYILWVYHRHNYTGIYVYIAAEAVEGTAQLRDGILPIEIVEARVSEILINPHNEQGNKTDKTILNSSLFSGWSPVQQGQTINKKKLDDFVNILNLNPDRYVSAVISRGSEPNSLALGYDVYEADPWHFYLMVDDAGSETRQWAPKLGLVNTNLTGADDKLSVMYQGPWGKGIEDNYAYFSAYEFPFFMPQLRLGVYGGRNEFDVSGGEGIDFLGRGSFYGGTLRLNALQHSGWFLDVTGTLTHEESKVTPTLFKSLGSDVDIDLWGIGVELHRSDDASSSSAGFNRIQSVGGSGQRRFWDPSTGTGARTNCDRHFTIYTVTAAHSQYLDVNEVHRVSGSFRWIAPDKRLPPSKMSVFGGLYSVRGYKEDEIVADGGMLASAQYEFNLVKYIESAESVNDESQRSSQDGWLSRAAVLCFTDFGRAKTIDTVAGEKGTQELVSAGLGGIFEMSDDITAAVYYGWALRATDETDRGQGRWSFSFVKRW
jgi:hemolysin activation/secretion protein